MLLVVLFWAGNFTATKVAFTEIPPLAFTALRFAAGSLILWWIVRRVEGEAPLPPGAFWRLTIMGVLGNTVYQLLFVEGLARTAVIKSSLILAILPVAVTVSAAWLGVEHVSRRQLWAVGIASLGVLTVLLARGGSIGGPIGTGDLLLLVAVVAWTGYTLLLRAWAPAISALRITAWTTYTGTPILVLVGLPQLFRTDWSAVSIVGWSGVAYSTLLSLVLAYILWNRAVTELGAARTAVFNCLVPFLSAIIAFVILDERPGILHVVGGVLIVGGVLLATQGDRARPAPMPE